MVVVLLLVQPPLVLPLLPPALVLPWPPWAFSAPALAAAAAACATLLQLLASWVAPSLTFATTHQAAHQSERNRVPATS